MDLKIFTEPSTKGRVHAMYGGIYNAILSGVIIYLQFYGWY